MDIQRQQLSLPDSGEITMSKFQVLVGIPVKNIPSTVWKKMLGNMRQNHTPGSTIHSVSHLNIMFKKM